MRSVPVCLAFAMVSGWAVSNARAWPCSEPVNYFTFGDPTPAPGSQGVARDSILMLRGRAFGIGGSPIVQSWFQVGEVKLTDQSGNEIPGAFSTRDFAQGTPIVGWAPGQLLAADTEYRVSAALAEQRSSRPDEAVGAETIEFSFTTGAGLTPPLQLAGGLTAQLRETAVPVSQCPADDPCPTSCPVTGQRPALLAQVTLPVVTGGADTEGYQGYLFLTDGTGVTFKGPGGTANDGSRLAFNVVSFHAQPGQTQSVTLEAPGVGAPYVPCFSMNVWDPAGHSAAAEVLCLDPVDPKTNGADTGKSGGGCALVGTPGRMPWWAFAPLAWLWRRPRRR